MTTDPTIITVEEIAEYRKEFADKPEALYALDLIAENDGDLVDAASLLVSDSGTREFLGNSPDLRNLLDS